MRPNPRIFPLLALLVAGLCQAQIYQWKDENGKTVFSDKPPVGQKRPSRTIEAPPPSAATEPAAPASTPVASPAAAEAANPGSNKPRSVADQEMEFRKRQKQARESQLKTEKAQGEAAEKNDYCTQARRNLAALESGERIARRDDAGERVYLDDLQREQEIAKLRQSIDSTCK